MWCAGIPIFRKAEWIKCSLSRSVHDVFLLSHPVLNKGKFQNQMQSFAVYSTLEEMNNDKDKGGGMSLAASLASVLDESSTPKKKPLTRMELKRLTETRIKKRVKEQYINGKYRHLMEKVIANPKILQDAYNCIRLDSNISLGSKSDDISFEVIAEELSIGGFDVKANTFSIATKGENKEVLVLPNLKLKIVQEAIRIVVEIVYRPHFSKISHGFRSGRGHRSAIKYISKEISNLDWWFTLHMKKKVDSTVFTKLVSTMEEKIEDPSLYSILRDMLDAEVLNLEFGGFQKGQGLPQEGVLSATLMNIYLDLFDHELYKMQMRYEAFGLEATADKEKQISTLRSWFRRQLKDDSNENLDKGDPAVKLHACRYMDEIFIAISSSKENAVQLKSDIQKFVQDSLHLDMDVKEVLPVNSPRGIRFLGNVIRISTKDSPAVRAVHKLKDKVRLFASQKQEIWDAMAVRIGKKCLGHGLKKVKESEIKHLADSSSVLSEISHLRKVGMETDHWFKVLVKIWMQDVNGRYENSEEAVIAKYITEPVLPQELRDSFYNLQKQAQEYVLSETASTLELLPDSISTNQPTITEILAPVDVIRKRLLRYGLVNREGYPRPVSSLILQDNSEIIDWFSGLVRRWLRWFSECSNFVELKLMITEKVRMSCIRTLASKHRIHETEIEKKFELELSGIPSTQDLELELMDDKSDSWVYDEDEALNYGTSHSGLIMLSLSRMVNPSRPCNCFVMGCLAPAPSVYTLHVMERQKFPGWKTGFSVSIHPSLNKRRIGLCKQHLKDLYLGHVSLQSVEFGAWK